MWCTAKPSKRGATAHHVRRPLGDIPRRSVSRPHKEKRPEREAPAQAERGKHRIVGAFDATAFAPDGRLSRT